MSDQDLDLITDLIGGRLSPGERDAALARIASDPTLQSEYEVQLATASLLHDLPAPAMTAAERTALRASLREQLQLGEVAAPVVAPAPSRWQRWWAPATALAAAAAVVVGALVILPGGGSDDSSELVAAVLSETDQTSRNADTAAGGETHADGALSDETATTTAAAEDRAPDAAAETTTSSASAETTTTAAASSIELGEAPTMGALPHLPDQDLEEIALAYGDGSSSSFSPFDSSTAADAAVDLERAEVCVDAASAAVSPSVVTPVATTTVAGADAVVLSVAPPEEDLYFVVVEIATCRELASTRS